MSRYALVWARQQQPGDAESKLVLLLLADHAGGQYHRCWLREDTFLVETGLTFDRLTAALDHLRDLGLITAWRRGAGNRGIVRLNLDLLIPSGWRGVGSGAPFKRDPAWFASRTAIYRLYSATGVLLYIGIAVSPQKRFKQHAATQPWWPEVATREIEWLENRTEADREEILSITTEFPVYNIDGTEAMPIFPPPGRPRPTAELRHVITEADGDAGHREGHPAAGA